MSPPVSPGPPPVVPPHLLKVCQLMDEHLARYVGPLASDLSAEAMQAWVRSGKRLAIADLRGYLRLLAAYIPDAEQCKRFEAEMTAFLRRIG